MICTIISTLCLKWGQYSYIYREGLEVFTWLKEFISNLQAMSGQLVTIVVPHISSMDNIWVKINANMHLMGVKVGTALCKAL